jgi:hypothetical protein
MRNHSIILIARRVTAITLPKNVSYDLSSGNLAKSKAAKHF